MAVRLSEVERAYFVRKSGTATPTKPLNQIKREYWGSQVTTINANVPFNEAELRWILKVLATAGITPQNPNSTNQLWKEMVLSISKSPQPKIEENKIIFYVNAP